MLDDSERKRILIGFLGLIDSENIEQMVYRAPWNEEPQDILTYVSKHLGQDISLLPAKYNKIKNYIADINNAYNKILSEHENDAELKILLKEAFASNVLKVLSKVSVRQIKIKKLFNLNNHSTECEKTLQGFLDEDFRKQDEGKSAEKKLKDAAEIKYNSQNIGVNKEKNEQKIKIEVDNIFQIEKIKWYKIQRNEYEYQLALYNNKEAIKKNNADITTLENKRDKIIEDYDKQQIQLQKEEAELLRLEQQQRSIAAHVRYDIEEYALVKENILTVNEVQQLEHEKLALLSDMIEAGVLKKNIVHLFYIIRRDYSNNFNQALELLNRIEYEKFYYLVGDYILKCLEFNYLTLKDIDYIVKTDLNKLANLAPHMEYAFNSYPLLKLPYFIVKADLIATLEKLVINEISNHNQETYQHLALITAILKKDAPLIMRLTNNGLDTIALNNDISFMFTELYVNYNRAEIFLFAIPFIDANVIIPRHFSTALQFATLTEDVPIVEKLLAKSNIKVNYAKDNGMTALHNAAFTGNTQIIKLFLAHPDTNLNIQDKFGKTPLHYAAEYGHTDAFNLLLNRGANPSFVDQSGRKPSDYLDSHIQDLQNWQDIQNLIDHELIFEPMPGDNCDISIYRAKRSTGEGLCKEVKPDEDLYEPLEDTVTLKQARASKLYSHLASAVILRHTNEFPNLDIKSIVTYYTHIGNILAEGSNNHSPREKQILIDHYKQAQQFFEKYSEDDLFKKISLTSNSGDKVEREAYIFDNGELSFFAYKDGKSYYLYSQDFNYKYILQPHNDISFAQIEKFVAKVFKLRSGNDNYQILTLADALPPELLEELKGSIFAHLDKVIPDSILLETEYNGLIESIPRSVVAKLFLLNGKSIDAKALHLDFLKHNQNNISIMIDVLHEVILGLKSEQIKALVAAIKKYNFSIDKSYIEQLPAEEKSFMISYANAVESELQSPSTVISAKKLSELSLQSLEHELRNHPDITPELARDIVKNVRIGHDNVANSGMLKGSVTQTLFFLPDIIKSANTGDMTNVWQLGGMLAADTTINHLYQPIATKLGTLFPKVKFLVNLPMGPIFKAVTMYSAVELYKEYNSLPVNSERRSIVKHEFGEGCVTLGLMVAEIFGFEVAPLWALLMIEQNIFAAQTFREANHLDISLWDAWLMSLGFEQGRLHHIFEERMLTELSLSVVDDVNKQIQPKYGWTIVRVPDFLKSRWTEYQEYDIPFNIRQALYEQAKTSHGARTFVVDNYRLVYKVQFKVSGIGKASYGNVQKDYQKRVDYVSQTSETIKLGCYQHYESDDSFFLKNVGKDSNWNQEVIKNPDIKGREALREFIKKSTTLSLIDLVAPALPELFCESFNIRDGNKFAALYTSSNTYNNTDAQSNIFTIFDPRDGDTIIDITDDGLRAINMINKQHNSAFKINPPYHVTIYVGQKPYPAHMHFFIKHKEKSIFKLEDTSTRIISHYIINDSPIGYYISDITPATYIKFQNINQKDNCTYNSIRGESNMIIINDYPTSIAKILQEDLCTHSKPVSSSIINLSANKYHLELDLGSQVILDFFKPYAEHINIWGVKGQTIDSKLVLDHQVVKSFKTTIFGNINIMDNIGTALQVKGLCASPNMIKFEKITISNNHAVFTIGLDDILPVLRSLTTQPVYSNSTSSPQIANPYLLYIKFMLYDCQYQWQTISNNTTLLLHGDFDHGKVYMQVDANHNILQVLPTTNSTISKIEIMHYKNDAINMKNSYLIKGAVVSNLSRLNNFNKDLFLNERDHNILCSGRTIKFGSLDGSTISHCHSQDYDNITINNIVYNVVGTELYAIGAPNNTIDAMHLIPANNKKHIYITTSIYNTSLILDQAGNIVINGITLYNVTKDITVLFNNTKVPMRVLLDITKKYHLHSKRDVSSVENYDDSIMPAQATSSAIKSHSWINDLFYIFIKSVPSIITTKSKVVESYNDNSDRAKEHIMDTTNVVSASSNIKDEMNVNGNKQLWSHTYKLSCVPYSHNPYTEEYTPQISECSTFNANIRIFSNVHQGKHAMQSNNYHIDGDHYDIKSCHPLEFFGRSSVYCEGIHSNIVYTPNIIPRVFDNINDNLMLLQVLIHCSKTLWKWCTVPVVKKEQEYTELSQEMYCKWQKGIVDIQTLILCLNDLEITKVDMHFIRHSNQIIEDLQYEMQELIMMDRADTNQITAFSQKIATLLEELKELEQSYYHDAPEYTSIQTGQTKNATSNGLLYNQDNAMSDDSLFNENNIYPTLTNYINCMGLIHPIFNITNGTDAELLGKC